MAETIDFVFRDFNTPGLPGSGEYEPEKPRIRRLLRQIQGGSGQSVTAPTLAALEAITPPAETYLGIVLNDPDPTVNGYYYREDGDWVLGRGFPDTFAEMGLTGSTSSQVGVVDAGVNPADVEIFWADVQTENDGPLLLNGLPVLNLAGNPLTAGEWTGAVLFVNRGDHWQLIIDAGAAASAAASASAAAADADRADLAADRAQNAASAVTSRAWFDYVSTLLADDNNVIGYVGSGADFEVGAGDIIEAQGFRYEVAASGANTSLETAGAVKINLMSHVWRPAAYGIFSSPSDQVAALREFVTDAADFGATIEWGKIDLSIDVFTFFGDDRGLHVPSGSHWVMHPDFHLRAIPQAHGSYEVLRIHDKQNVVIEGNGGNIWGERGGHTGVDGEWGMGVSIRGSSKVKIFDLNTHDCWGDGWYIGVTDAQNYVADTELIRITADNCRRQGLSLISARGLLVQDGVFTNTAGVAPQWGVDIEPNFPSEFLENIEFVRPITKANINGHGFGIFLTAMAGGLNKVGIRVDDALDDGSQTGFGAHYVSSSPLPGSIEFNNPKSINALFSGISNDRYNRNGPALRFNNPIIEDWNRSGSTSANFGAAIAIFSASGTSGVASIGNIKITNPDLRLNSGSATNAIFLQDARPGSEPMTDVEIIDPISLADRPVWLPGGEGSITVADAYRKNVRILATGSETVSPSNYAHHCVVPTLSGTVTKDISQNFPIGTEIEFRLSGGGTCVIRFPVGTALNPDSLGVNRSISASARGSSIRLRKTSSTEWITVNKVGTWASS